MEMAPQEKIGTPLVFHGGLMGAIIPFIVFVTGVMIIALSGAPDEKGFWPILILSIAIGLFLAKDKQQYAETVISGMSQPIVMIMITAWILASSIGVLMSKTGFIDSLIWLTSTFDLSGTGFVVAAFIICCIVSLSTGSSFATILICGPLLYPAGGLIGSPLPVLAGSILAGATFGDFVAPISDTTIASALSQQTDIGSVVKSRIKYILPVGLLALLLFLVSSIFLSTTTSHEPGILSGNPRGLPMLLVPVAVIFLFLRGKHLMHGLMFGLILGTILGWSLGLLPLSEILSLDLKNFTAKSFVIDGINRSVGLSFFTILLMGLVATIKSGGIMEQLVKYASRNSSTSKQGELWITGSVSLSVLLTTHSIVAILMVADFVKNTGQRLDIPSIHRANLLSMVGCVFPFLLPYFIPVLLMANMTTTGSDYGIQSVAPLEVGMYNFVSWGLLATLIFVILLKKK